MHVSWICRKDWKLHNSETGGFFRCNRWQEDSEDHEYYDTPPPTATEQQTEDSQLPTEERSDAPHLVDQGYGSAMHSARSAWKKSRTMARFLHHYRRWIAHSESAALERHMADTACSRLAPVIEAAIEFSGFSDFNFGGKGKKNRHLICHELFHVLHVCIMLSGSFSLYLQGLRLSTVRLQNYLSADLSFSIVTPLRLRVIRVQVHSGIIESTRQESEKREHSNNFSPNLKR